MAASSVKGVVNVVGLKGCEAVESSDGRIESEEMLVRSMGEFSGQALKKSVKGRNCCCEVLTASTTSAIEVHPFRGVAVCVEVVRWTLRDGKLLKRLWQ